MLFMYKKARELLNNDEEYIEYLLTQLEENYNDSLYAHDKIHKVTKYIRDEQHNMGFNVWVVDVDGLLEIIEGDDE